MNKKNEITVEEFIKDFGKKYDIYHLEVLIGRIYEAKSKEELDDMLKLLLWALQIAIKKNDYILWNLIFKKLEFLADTPKFAEIILSRLKNINTKINNQTNQQQFDQRLEKLNVFLNLRTQNKCKCEEPWLYGFPENEKFLTVIEPVTIIKHSKTGDLYEGIFQCKICGKKWKYEELKDVEIRQRQWKAVD